MEAVEKRRHVTGEVGVGHGVVEITTGLRTKAPRMSGARGSGTRDIGGTEGEKASSGLGRDGSRGRRRDKRKEG